MSVDIYHLGKAAGGLLALAEILVRGVNITINGIDMKSFLKSSIFIIICIIVMQIVQHALEEYVNIPRRYAENIVTYPGIITTILVMQAFQKKRMAVRQVENCLVYF